MTDTAIAVTPKPKRIIGRPFEKGQSGNPSGGGGRARANLNQATIHGMQMAFDRGGQAAIDKVMKNRPETFLKLLVLLVPRELQVEHKGGVKGMTDEQLEQGIEAIKAMLAARAGDSAKTIEGVSHQVLSTPVSHQVLSKPKPTVRRKTRKTDMGESMGKGEDASDS